MKITRGIIERPQKVVLYGPEGIGKSTFASHFPEPLFIDVEGSTSQLDVSRVGHIESWQVLVGLVKEFNQSHGEFQTLVIDTADWAERLCIRYICERDRKAGIEDYGYGAGYMKLLEEFSRLLELLNDTIRAGANVVLTAHAQIRKFEQPDEMGAYDRWELKLNKKTTAQTAALVKEWADAVLFANYKTMVMTDEKNKKKAVGGARVLYTQHRPTWDAKNRWGLPEEVPFEFSSIAAYIPVGDRKPKTAEKPAEKKGAARKSVTEAKKKAVTDKKHDEDQADTEATLSAVEKTIPAIREVKKVMDQMEKDNITEAQVRHAVALKGYFPESMSIADYPADFIEGVLIGAWDQIKDFIDKNCKVPF